MELLGSIYSPWQVTARLVLGSGSHADARLIGASTVPFKLGVATFDELSISHAGSDYTLEFEVTKPTNHSLSQVRIAFLILSLAIGGTRSRPQSLGLAGEIRTLGVRKSAELVHCLYILSVDVVFRTMNASDKELLWVCKIRQGHLKVIYETHDACRKYFLWFNYNLACFAAGTT